MILPAAVYRGYDVHAYTSQIAQACGADTTLTGELTDEVFQSLLGDLERRLGPKPAYQNFRQHYRAGAIRDPELPGVNVAVLLQKVWERVQRAADESMQRHFAETLDDIGMTCIQGISHRLFLDYQALGATLPERSQA